jgi:AraC-like DNA-binding protein
MMKKDKRTVGFIPTPPTLSGLLKYWSFSTAPGRGGASRLTFMPDGHLEMIFDLKAANRDEQARIWGVQRNTFVYDITRPVELIGVKFLPGAFYSLFRVSAKRMTGRVLPLHAGLSRYADAFTGVYAGNNRRAAIAHLNKVFTELAAKRLPIDPGVERALKRVYSSGGRISVPAMAQGSNCSERWFLENFKKWVGIPPQAFLKYYKLVKTIKALNAGSRSLDATYRFGFWDQAHLTRSFKRQFGITPADTRRKMKTFISLYDAAPKPEKH